MMHSGYVIGRAAFANAFCLCQQVRPVNTLRGQAKVITGEDQMNSTVERAIKCICERYSEPLSLADVANSAILSRFHFSRIFRDATGVTPGRFLSAVRI